MPPVAGAYSVEWYIQWRRNSARLKKKVTVFYCQVLDRKGAEHHETPQWGYSVSGSILKPGITRIWNVTTYHTGTYVAKKQTVRGNACHLPVSTWATTENHSCQLYVPAVCTPQEIFLALISLRGRVDPWDLVRPEYQYVTNAYYCFGSVQLLVIS